MIETIFEQIKLLNSLLDFDHFNINEIFVIRKCGGISVFDKEVCLYTHSFDFENNNYFIWDIHKAWVLSSPEEVIKDLVDRIGMTLEEFSILLNESLIDEI